MGLLDGIEVSVGSLVGYILSFSSNELGLRYLDIFDRSGRDGSVCFYSVSVGV